MASASIERDPARQGHTADQVCDERRLDPRATLGGLAVAYAPVQFLKLLLGCVLIVVGGKTMSGHRRGKRPRERPIARVENARRIMGRGRQREEATSRPWCRRGGVRCPPVGVGVRDLIAR